MSKYQARVIEDPHDPNLRWLRVTHNGNSYSTIRIDADDEILQMISALQQSVQQTACLGGNAHIVIKGSDVCMICGANLEASRR